MLCYIDGQVVDISTSGYGSLPTVVFQLDFMSTTALVRWSLRSSVFSLRIHYGTSPSFSSVYLYIVQIIQEWMSTLLSVGLRNGNGGSRKGCNALPLTPGCRRLRY